MTPLPTPTDRAFDETRLYALVPCAGVGERAGTAGPKQYEMLAGSTVVGHTLGALAQVSRLHQVLVMLSPTDARFESLLPGFAGLLVAGPVIGHASWHAYRGAVAD
mgnify:CR=1 FL=1